MRRRVSRHASWSVVDMMGSIPQSPTSSTKSRPRSRDTGFPEPFCGNRNTTLPHPDADTSENACISQDDISITRVLSRQRRSFLAKPKHKRTISHGVITEAMEQMYSDMVMGGRHSSADTDSLADLKPSRSINLGSGSSGGRPSKDGNESLGVRSDASGDEGDSPIEPRRTNALDARVPQLDAIDPQAAEHKKHRGSMLRKLMHR